MFDYFMVTTKEKPVVVTQKIITKFQTLLLQSLQITKDSKKQGIMDLQSSHRITQQ